MSHVEKRLQEIKAVPAKRRRGRPPGSRNRAPVVPFVMKPPQPGTLNVSKRFVQALEEGVKKGFETAYECGAAGDMEGVRDALRKLKAWVDDNLITL